MIASVLGLVLFWRVFQRIGVPCEESDSGRKLLSVPTYHFCVGVLGTQCGGLHGRILPKPNRYVNN